MAAHYRLHRFIPGKLLNNQMQQQPLKEERTDFRISRIDYLTNTRNEICEEMGKCDPYSRGKSSQYNNIQDLKNLINQFYLIDIYRTLHSVTAEYLFFSSACGK